jgi:hypothetical protein
MYTDIEDDFKEYVQQFISSLLSPSNLVVKEINGTQITGKELVEYFKVKFVYGSTPNVCHSSKALR